MSPEIVALTAIKYLKSSSIEKLLSISSPFLQQRNYSLGQITWSFIPNLPQILQKTMLIVDNLFYRIMDDETWLCAVKFDLVCVILMKFGADWKYHDLSVDLDTNQWSLDIQSAKKRYSLSAEADLDVSMQDEDEEYWARYKQVLRKKRELLLTTDVQSSKKKVADLAAPKTDPVDSDEDYWNNYG